MLGSNIAKLVITKIKLATERKQLLLRLNRILIVFQLDILYLII